MRRRLLAVGLAVALPVLAAAAAHADEVSVEALLLAPDAFQGEITVTGELIGDYGDRGDGSVWTQLNGDPYAAAPLLESGELRGGNLGIGVRLPAALVEELDPPGGYRLRGPLVRVTGQWRYHDSGRGGESYLDVDTVELVEPGRPLEEGVSWPRLGVGAALVAIAAGAWFGIRRPET